MLTVLSQFFLKIKKFLFNITCQIFIMAQNIHIFLYAFYNSTKLSFLDNIAVLGILKTSILLCCSSSNRCHRSSQQPKRTEFHQSEDVPTLNCHLINTDEHKTWWMEWREHSCSGGVNLLNYNFMFSPRTGYTQSKSLKGFEVSRVIQ